MACKHQAAVARAFNIYTVGLVPFHSREARHTFAILARGEGNTMDTEFYVDLRSKDSVPSSTMHNSAMKTYNAAEVSSLSPGSPGPSPQDDDDDDVQVSENGTDPLEQLLPSIHKSLGEVVEDMLDRVKQGDHSFISGLNKFIISYKAMQKSSLAPTPSISYALHNFGCPDREFQALLYYVPFLSSKFNTVSSYRIHMVTRQKREVY